MRNIKQDNQRKGKGVGVKCNCPLASCETAKPFEHPCWTSPRDVFCTPAAWEASGLVLGWVKREEMVQEEFSSSARMISSVCLAGKWPLNAPPTSLGADLRARSPGHPSPPQIPTWWWERKPPPVFTLCLGQPGPAAGNCFHQPAIRGNLLQLHLIPGVFLFLHPYLLMSL